MADATSVEAQCLNQLTTFNEKSRRVEIENSSRRVKQNIDVLTRAVCSVENIIRETGAPLELIRVFPEGTIFTRTCREKGRGGGLCGQDLRSETTFTNLTTLGNLMIGNPQSVNDSVVFLKTKHPVKFLDLNIISQLFGAQVKSGVRAGSSSSRGIFSACCPITDMPDFCSRLGVEGVIQTDSADAYYFNEDPHWIPNALNQGTIARRIANELVLEAIKSKCAYPVFEEGVAYVGVGVPKSGAIFPEFNFHTKDLKGCLEYCTIRDHIFLTGPLQILSHPAVPHYRFDTVVPYWKLNEILLIEDVARVYLNFQKNYQFQQISHDYQWVVPYFSDVLQLNPTLLDRQRLINTEFKGRFVGLPYLTGNIDWLIRTFEFPIIQLLISDVRIPVQCGQQETVTIWDETKGGRKKTRVKRKKRTPYRTQKTKRNSKLKPRRRRKGRTRRSRYKKKAGKTRH